eukprot:3431144-Pyramimonas_sp.AAC.1
MHPRVTVARATIKDEPFVFVSTYLPQPTSEECYYETSNLILGYISTHHMPGDTTILGADFNAELGPN